MYIKNRDTGVVKEIPDDSWWEQHFNSSLKKEGWDKVDSNLAGETLEAQAQKAVKGNKRKSAAAKQKAEKPGGSAATPKPPFQGPNEK